MLVLFAPLALERRVQPLPAAGAVSPCTGLAGVFSCYPVREASSPLHKLAFNDILETELHDQPAVRPEQRS